MRNWAFMILVFSLYSCEKEKTIEKEKTVVIDTKTSNQEKIIADKNREIDSLKKIISDKNQVNSPKDTISPPINNPVVKPSTGLKDLSGKHSLTLQWISWEKPGTVLFKKIAKGKYKVSGSQKLKNDYLKIEGTITQVTDLELTFDGTIRYRSAIINNGEECVKTGKQMFLSINKRKYWRMQNMLNCDANSTDYVDIYF